MAVLVMSCRGCSNMRAGHAWPPVQNLQVPMPAIVDHDARRRRIAEIVVGIIARQGIDAATVRQVSAASGFSTSVVTHYFSGKKELLIWAHRIGAEQYQARFDRALARDPADLVGCLESLLPIGQEGMDIWRVFFAFRQLATVDPEIAELERFWFDHALKLISDVLCRRYGDDAATEVNLEMLMATVQGIAVQAIFDPEKWTPERQRALLLRQIYLQFRA